MATEFTKKTLLIILLLLWGARPLLPSLLPITDSKLKTEIKAHLPENPLSNLHDWILNTETTLKTLPIQNRENFLENLEGIKVNFAKLIQIPLQKIDQQKKEDGGPEKFLQGPEANHFYQRLETLFKERVRLEKNIMQNLERYGLKV